VLLHQKKEKMAPEAAEKGSLFEKWVNNMTTMRVNVDKSWARVMDQRLLPGEVKHSTALLSPFLSIVMLLPACLLGTARKLNETEKDLILLTYTHFPNQINWPVQRLLFCHFYAAFGNAKTQRNDNASRFVSLTPYHGRCVWI
jgi:hypothetical protein